MGQLEIADNTVTVPVTFPIPPARERDLDVTLPNTSKLVLIDSLTSKRYREQWVVPDTSKHWSLRLTVQSFCSEPFMTSHPLTTSPSSDLESLRETEIFWRDNFSWFKDQGYQLRPRFAPDWIPSWKGTSKFRLQCEDGHPLLVSFFENANLNTLTFMYPVRPSQWCPACPYWVACCFEKTIQRRSSIWGGYRAPFIVGSSL